MQVMISQPVTDISAEEMAKARAEVVAMLETQCYEVVGKEVNRDKIPLGMNQDLWLLGEELQDMAGADAVYFMDGWENSKVCGITYESAKYYGIAVMTRTHFIINEQF